MNKYLVGSTYKIPMVSDEVPSIGSLQSVAWTLHRVSPADVTNTDDLTGTFLAVDNPSGSITLAVTGAGTRSVWRLTYTYTTTTSVNYTYTDTFIIESEETLIKGENSFQDYWESFLTAETVSGVEFYKSASKDEQVSAMNQAYTILCSQVYADNSGDHYNIGGYDAAKLDALEPGFLNALKIAQVIEANEMLDVNSIHYKRQDGLMSETIGESSMMFRPGNINNGPLTRRSTLFLRNYLVIRARLYRA